MGDGMRRSVLLGVAAVLFVAACALFFWHTTDDAFISLRYARNLASGDGLVFNPGERVEGFSNLLWVLLLSIPEGLGVDGLLAAKFLGIACGVLTLLAVAAIARRHLELPDGLTFLGLVFLATCTGFVYYSISGLETILYALLISLLCFALLERRYVAAALVCGALVLTRPDGVLFLVPLAVLLAVEWPGVMKGRATIAIALAFLAGLLAFRVSYYGAVLPNTHYAKIDASLPLPLFLALHTKALITYTFSAFLGRHAVLALAVLGAFHVPRGRRLPLVLAVAAAAVFVWYSAGDWMSFGRFYVPVLPIVVLLWLVAVDRIRRSVVGARLRQAVVLALVIVPLVLSAVDMFSASRKLVRLRDVNPAMSSRTHAEIGRYLGEIGSPGDRVVVNEVGAIAYYSGLDVIDMLGLTDRKAARLAREESLEAYADYILSLDPRFVLLNDRQEPWDTAFHPLHAAIRDRMLETGRYRADRAFGLSYYKNLILFVREG